MPISRRSFLIGGASAAVLAACSKDGDDVPASTADTPDALTVRTPDVPLTKDPFGLGVASGDPETESVVLWTRLLGAEGDHDVVWEVVDLDRRVVASGVATATDDDAHTVHVVAGGLRPGTGYRYRFIAGDFRSPSGRTVTAPEGDVESLRFAFASCQDWQDGYYTAHEHLAAEDVALVIWLGDYVYESGISTKAVRPHDTPEVTTLDTYRARYALYKSDPNLRAVHARAPWFVIWDDHEVDNNYAGHTPEIGAPDVDFTERRAAAYRAWWEHQPTRLPKPNGDSLVSYRALQWGSLATIFGLDGRQYRDDQSCERPSDIGPGCAARDDPKRTMLGAEQEAWVADELPASTSTWNVVANQTILSPAAVPLGDIELYNLDQWDGYPAARDRMLDVLATTANPVVVTGDIHLSAVGEVRRGEDTVAVELVGPAISSSFPAQYADLFEAAAKAAGAPMIDAKHNGYVVCEVTPERLRASYRVVDTVLAPTATISTASSWEITAGTPGVQPLA